MKHDKFQSLSGFQVRCNFPCSNPFSGNRDVSIPIGFSSSLQPLSFLIISRSFTCFNPYRVFKFVATPHAPDVTTTAITFQSLSGFQVRCNISLYLFDISLVICFNPYRVFKFVATWLDMMEVVVLKSCFNPYRVFKFVATERMGCTWLRERTSFNPYRVFKFVATLWPIIVVTDG